MEKSSLARADPEMAIGWSVADMTKSALPMVRAQIGAASPSGMETFLDVSSTITVTATLEMTISHTVNTTPDYAAIALTVIICDDDISSQGL
jgi:hypothetical protein